MGDVLAEAPPPAPAACPQPSRWRRMLTHNRAIRFDPAATCRPDPRRFAHRASSVRLEPISSEHHDGLVAAAEDGALWRLWYTSVPDPHAMATEIARRLGLQEAGSMAPFTVFSEPDGVIAGMTTYMNVDAVNRRVEIGSTWYARSVQRSGLNTEAKLLLLGHAFETLDCIAVEFPDPLPEPAEPSRDRAAWRQARWHPAVPHAGQGRQPAGHLCLQHHRGRVAGDPDSPAMAAGKAALIDHRGLPQDARHLAKVSPGATSVSRSMPTRRKTRRWKR